MEADVLHQAGLTSATTGDGQNVRFLVATCLVELKNIA